MSTALDKITVVFSDPTHEEICQDIWTAHLDWLAKCGFERALDQQDPPPELITPTGHEVVDMLSRFVSQTGLVNAHLGLTSSDVVDNARLVLIQLGLAVLRNRVADLCIHLRDSFKDVNGLQTVGFTHWQAAAPITWEHRVEAWISPLTFLQSRTPLVFAKMFGGPVGNAATLKKIIPADRWKPFDWSSFDIEYPVNHYPIQSSDHQSEQHAVAWITQVAAQVHKIAADLRFLCAKHEVRPTRKEGHAGSSSMAHKLNPHKWEKVCSICRSVSTTQGEMWSVAAHNGLERTLDTSWQLKSLLRRAFTGLAEALDIMVATQIEVNVYSSAAQLSNRLLRSDSDAELTRRVLAGEDRWSAYLSLLKNNNL